MSNNVTKGSAPSGVELKLATLANGLATGIPQDTVLHLGQQKSQSIADILATVNKLVAAHEAVRQLRASLAVALGVVRQGEPAEHDLLVSVKAALVAYYGEGSPELAKFGFTPLKRRAPLSSEARLQATAKSKATRAKRQTLGKRQREALGTAAGPTISVTREGEVLVTPAEQSASATPSGSAGGGSSSVVAPK